MSPFLDGIGISVVVRIRSLGYMGRGVLFEFAVLEVDVVLLRSLEVQRDGRKEGCCKAAYVGLTRHHLSYLCHPLRVR